MGAELLRRQIARLEDDNGGKFDGPLSLEHLGKASARDLDSLNFAARLLDQGAEKSLEGVAGRGRNAAGSDQSRDAAGPTGQPGGAAGE